MSRDSSSGSSISERRDESPRVSNCEDYPTRRDRLSELPDSLILEILSLMDMDDVVRTTILSKRWKDLWTTVPCLHFFYEDENSFIEAALAKWKGMKILKFSFSFWECHPSNDTLDSWLLLPIEKQVEELHVSVGFHMQCDDYCFPQRLYSCSSFTKLFLAYAILKIEENVQWFKLKCLTLERVDLSDDPINRILSGAPLLEKLVLWSLRVEENINIRSSSLKILEISRGRRDVMRTVVDRMLKIWAPNLLSLEISACVFATCLLDVPSLTKAALCFEMSCDIYGRIHADFPPLEMFHEIFRNISHVEKLTLSHLSIQLLLDMKEDDIMITFSNTKFLKLYPGDVNGMLDVLEMFPRLMTLEVELHKDYYDFFKYEKFKVDVFEPLTSKATFPCPSLHHLKSVEISWCACDPSIAPAIEILVQNACMLDKMAFRPKSLL